MKKLFIVVLAAIGMVSCMNTDEVIEVNSDNAIAFNDAFVENSVRAMIDNDSFNQFNVWGWMEDTEGGDVTATVFDAVKVTNSGAGWTYSPAQYWVPGFKYHFQALSSNMDDRNWTATAANGAVSVVEFTNENGTEDLVYATAEVLAPALGATETVQLNFAHQLAKVKFTFAYDAQLSSALGGGLSVLAENIRMVAPKNAKINYANGTAWEDHSGTVELAFAKAGDEKLTIPAEDYTYEISFDVNLYKNGTEKVKTLVTKTARVTLDVAMGCSYNFTAELTPENLQMDTIDFTPVVNPWNPENGAGFAPDVTMTQVAEGVFTDPAGVYHIYDKNGLTWLADAVNGNLATTKAAGAMDFNKKTIKLMNNIDLAGMEWTPIGQGSNHFRGTFDGNGKTIKNMTITKRNDSRAALFGTVSYTVVIKNLTIEAANVDCPDFNGDFYGAALIGTAYGYVTFENVNVVDSYISGNNKVGALIAHDGVMNTLTVENCHVLNTTFEALNAEDGGSVGGLLGYFQTGNEHHISNSSVKGCTFNVVNSTNSGKRANGQLIGGIDSKAGQRLYIDDCVVENNTWNEKFYVDGTEVTEGTFVSPYGILIGGERNDVAEGKVYVDGVEVNPAANVANKLIEDIANVEDGGTVYLSAPVTIDENTRYHNSGNWYDGIYYEGDKSFTLDLNGQTLTHDGSVNDYMINIKNAGSKPNTITIKNGKIDAGTTAFCALCTSTTSTQQITINLENVELINNISNGSTVKLRGGAVLNVKEGTKITGKNSYLGIEVVASTCNIYDGAEIYQNGTSSYLGGLVGVCGNGVANVYGGYGKSVRCGFIAMTSGGVINVAGGEWIANTDGSIGDNSNVYVLTAQNNKYESGYRGASIINVTGGTFRGGMDAWILNDVNVEKAELNISGGNFNANPTAYVENGYQAVEENGIYTVEKKPGISSVDELVAAINNGETTLTLSEGETLNLTETIEITGNKEVTLNLNGGTITAGESGYAINVLEGAKLTIEGNGTINGVVYTEEAETTINSGTFNALPGGAYVLLNSKGTLTINGGTINECTTYPIYSYDAGNKLVINDVTINGTFGCVNAYGTGGEVEINGGTFQMTGVQGNTSHIAYFSSKVKATIKGGTFKKIGDINMSGTGGGGICANGGANVTIEGGIFAGDYADVYNWGNNTTVCSIKGGTFKFQPTNVAEGYKAEQNADGTWTVTVK